MQPHLGRMNSVRTNNEANFTVRVFIATSHHSSNCVIHHGNHIQVKLLMARRRCLLHKSQCQKLQDTYAHMHAHTHTPNGTCYGPFFISPAPAQTSPPQTETHTSTGQDIKITTSEQGRWISQQRAVLASLTNQSLMFRTHERGRHDGACL